MVERKYPLDHPLCRSKYKETPNPAKYGLTKGGKPASEAKKAGRPKKNQKQTKTLSEDEIKNLGLNAIQQYFMTDIESIDPATIKHLHLKAKIGMQFSREHNLSKRSVERNYLRVFQMVAEDKKELKKLIKGSLPKYLK